MTERRKEYGHGPGRPPAKEADFDRLTAEDIDRKVRRQLNSIQRNMAKTQAWYLNARARKGLDDGAPSYILSDVRFKDYGFPVSWVAPNPNGFRVTRKGVIRPWQFVAFHCFGETYDGRFLAKHRGRISVPVGEDGYSPTRFLSAVRYLTAWTKTPRFVGVHFNISRRGDFVSNVDLNDTAWATGGAVKVGFSMNTHSIGFELESHLARFIPGPNTKTRKIYRQPFTDKQLLCLAVALRKINSWRPVIKIEWRATAAEIKSAYTSGAGGCVQHRTLAPSRRTDPGAQFNIPAGTMAAFGSAMWNGTGTSTSGPGPMMRSGWDQLSEMYESVPAVNLATEVFQTPLTPSAIALAQTSELLGLAKHPGQQAAIRVGRNRLAAYSRSEQMQAQSRRTLYRNAARSGASLAALAGKTNATVSAGIRRFDTVDVKGVDGAVMFNEETGLWEDGDA